MDKDFLKENITLLISKSKRMQETSSGMSRFITLKDLILSIKVDNSILEEVLCELNNDKYIYFSKSLQIRFDNGQLFNANTGSIYLKKLYKKSIKHVINKVSFVSTPKIEKTRFIDFLFIIVLLLGVFVSTTYTRSAISLIGLDLKFVAIVISVLVSSLSIICHYFLRRSTGLDRVFMFVGLVMLLMINVFCTTTVIINDYESDRVSINSSTMNFQMYNEEKRIIIDSINSTHKQILVQQDLSKKLVNDSQDLGNDSKFYERQSRRLSSKIEALNIELNEINKKISDLANENVDFEKKKSSYDVIASIFQIDPSIVALLVSILLSLVYDFFCPFLIGIVLSKK